MERITGSRTWIYDKSHFQRIYVGDVIVFDHDYIGKIAVICDNSEYGRAVIIEPDGRFRVKDLLLQFSHGSMAFFPSGRDVARLLTCKAWKELEDALKAHKKITAVMTDTPQLRHLEIE